MCHECGKFYYSLANEHVRKHGLNEKEYKTKYGLLKTTSLLSNKIRDKRRAAQKILLLDSDYLEKKRQWMANARLHRKTHGRERTPEFENRNDTCPAQLIRWLTDAAKIYGDNITYHEAENYRPGFNFLLRSRFGTFNKAKQIAKLAINHSMNEKLEKHLILEDMCSFYSKYNRWPMLKDYKNGMMLCSRRPIRSNGGLVALRQEAISLEKIHDAYAKLALRVSWIADKIELGYAGFARR